MVRAVDGVSLTLARGKTLGVVGESGSGKTVLSRSIMGLLPGARVERSGTVRLAGHDLTTMTPAELRQVWGTQVAMVFQDPMTALNPVVRIGRQITEALRKKRRPRQARPPTRRRWPCSPRWASPPRDAGCATTPTSSPAACASGS